MSALNEAIHRPIAALHVTRQRVEDYLAEAEYAPRFPTPLTQDQSEAAIRRIDGLVISFQTGDTDR